MMVDSAKQSDESAENEDGIEDLPEVEGLEEVTEPGLGAAARTSAPPPIPPQARHSRTPALLDAPNRLSAPAGASEPAYAYRALPPPPVPAGARNPGSAPPSSGVYVIDPRALPPLPPRASSSAPMPVPAPGSSFSGVLREDATQPRYQPDAHRLEARIRELEAKLRLRDDLINELERSLKEQRRRAAEADVELQRLREASVVSDDLKRIRGIGPGFEKKLHALGITRFEQIAAWSASDVAAIADRLGIQPLRIERDGWIVSAQALRAAR